MVKSFGILFISRDSIDMTMCWGGEGGIDMLNQSGNQPGRISWPLFLLMCGGLFLGVALTAVAWLYVVWVGSTIYIFRHRYTTVQLITLPVVFYFLETYTETSSPGTVNAWLVLIVRFMGTLAAICVLSQRFYRAMSGANQITTADAGTAERNDQRLMPQLIILQPVTPQPVVSHHPTPQVPLPATPATLAPAIQPEISRAIIAASVDARATDGSNAQQSDRFAIVQGHSVVLESTESLDIRVEFSYSTGRTDFLEKSKSLRTARVSGIPRHIPLQAYYTTFDDLNKSQLEWYLWWRQEWEQGRCHDTDLSYIFLFVYELIGLGYEPDLRLSFLKLCRLFEDYKDVHTKLDGYLPQWIGDMAWELGEDQEAARWYAMSDPRLAEAAAAGGTDRPADPVAAFLRQSSYNRTVYFREHEAELVSFISDHIISLDQTCHAQVGKPLIEVMNGGQPLEIRKYEHRLYSGAVVGRPVCARPLLQSAAQMWPLYQDMGNLVRCLENFHRISTGTTRLLKVDPETLPKPVRVYLESLAPVYKGAIPATTGRGGKSKRQLTVTTQPAESVKAVVFDPGLVKQLREENLGLADLLSDGPDTTGQQVPARTPAPVTAPASSTALDLGAVFGSSGDADFPAFWSELTDGQQTLLSGWFDGSDAILRVKAIEQAKQKGLMLAAVIDEINQVAVTFLGDPLVLEEDERFVLLPELRGRWDGWANTRGVQ